MKTNAQQRLKVEIHGAVQGVGFRPFVYRLATELNLTGWVINDSRGVFIEVDGPETALTEFLARLAADKPPRAIIQAIDHSWLAPFGYTQFDIRHSDGRGAKTVLVLPDIATCDDCLAEVLNPTDRRAGYAFTNCTNCGPRFSIIQALPYDRPHTTMRHFTMCPDCQAEYDNPLDRRFHAQPNACPVCGPQLDLRFTTNTFQISPPGPPKGGEMSKVPPSGGLVGGPLNAHIYERASYLKDIGFTTIVPAAKRSGNYDLRSQPAPESGQAEQPGDPLDRAAVALRAGRIVAVKGLGGFHLMVDAANTEAVARLRHRKPRPDKPLAVMVRDLAQTYSLCEIPPAAETLLASAEAPIVLLPRRPDAPVAANLAPGNPTLGVMPAYTPLHHLLLARLDGPVVATSGNLTDEPICTNNAEAIARLGHIADLFLLHNRPIERHVDDSVAWLVLDKPCLLRRARGYAPLPVLLKNPAPTILAVGAHLKNTIALSVERQVFISQHIGDLETAEAMAAFERVIIDFQWLYEATPIAIAHDLHPDYLSTQWAVAQPEVKLIPVQHHHAHLAACLAENQVDGPALGIIWDGTGYGLDGTIWGSEFLQGDAAGFSRAGHLRPFRLPGGEAAVKEPRRVALALLWELYGDKALSMTPLLPVADFTPTERRLLGQMLTKNLNCPVTTSAGRLFDGVAALIGLQQRVTFEGQAAMALEFAAASNEPAAYPLHLKDEGSRRKGENLNAAPFILDWEPLVEAVLDDLRRKIEPSLISARFHNGLIEAMVAAARQVGEPRVALSGGCFQNRYLTEQAHRRLSQAGFEVLLHRQVPPNDGGISLGQTAAAAARLSRA